MDKTFLDCYRDNLTHIRELSGEFAREFPKIAARLELTGSDCRDPYVERLLEGTAFLAARVEKKLNDGYPRLIESIVTAMAPSMLSPEPSGAVLSLAPDTSHPLARAGFTVPAGFRLDAKTLASETPCTFSTAAPTRILPLTLADAAYGVRDLAALRTLLPGALSALKLELQLASGSSWKHLPDAPLRIFCALSDEEASLLAQLALEDCAVIAARPLGSSAPFKTLTGVTLANPALDKHSGFFDWDPSRGFFGLQTLAAALAHPDFFKFIDIRGLPQALGQTLPADARAAEIALIFTKSEPQLIHAVSAESLKLFCAPALNLFPKRSDRQPIAENFEHRIIPSRRHPGDFEVHSVLSCEVFSRRNALLLKAARFYSASAESAADEEQSFFSMHRRERVAQPARKRQTSYGAADVYVSLSGARWRDIRPEAFELSADLLCTNADIPLFLSQNDLLRPRGDSAGLRQASFASAPSAPQPPLIRSGDRDDWEKLSHLFMNLSAVLWQPGSGGLSVVRKLVSHYSRRSPEETRRLIEGITSLSAAPRVFRFIRHGCVYFETGWRIELTLSSLRLEGCGLYIWGSVLRTLFESLAPINTHAEFVLLSEETGEVARWTIPGG